MGGRLSFAIGNSQSVDVYCLGTRALLQIKKGCVGCQHCTSPLIFHRHLQYVSYPYVTNTPWGERVTFLSNPNSDLVAKPLHVSPFMVGHPWELENENELTK
ncbi:galactose oxidase/kelch repeat superfamily protein [Striga asiatica]|uniref:Galactose oxidase/kelch repeat superfamily protein n=1 Tax=Striga asiatica TaxID=4170 RepID=A0A5A7P5G0_STRAF|nr:galactose oxidase/kelch repeat superfamily protein [Striga asiatica]